MTDDDTEPARRPQPPIIGLVIGLLAIAALGYAALSQRWLYAEGTQLQYEHSDGRTFSIGEVHDRQFGLRTTTACPTRSDSGCVDQTNGELLTAWRQAELEARYMLHEKVDDELATLISKDGMAALAAERDHFESPEDTLHDIEAREALAAKHIYASSSAFALLGWITFVLLLIAIPSLAVSCAIVVAGKRLRLPVMPTTTALLGIGISLITGCVFVATKPGPPGYVGVGPGFFVFGAGIVLGLYASLQLNRLMRPHDPDLLEDSMKPDEF